ncbi:2-dehydropantoate 2-reductase [Dactylosporangium sp. NBC_01737]|uniref:2-dehydropantoate 2-reductase n=1 Tax=Dactylosporangium sp. NBC_01737 TaxID=2975959 RepID=UPI002E142231|nr:2-dehydropantoate 2-reductase [Dactylosporangium sp. NBC_01737]
MKVCVVGAGAVGGVLGVRLAAAGLPVSVLARGATLAAIRSAGWRLRTSLGDATVHVTASDDPAGLGPQDLVLLTVKAHALPGLAPSLTPLLGPGTVVVAALNGVPWWFLHPRRLHSVDPTGSIAASVPVSSLLGCVVHLSASVATPGVVALHAENELILGAAPGGPDSGPAAGVLRGAGFSVRESADVRADIWYKLWGNMTVNPISALTGATADKILDDDLVNGFAHAVMREAAEIGARIGCPVGQSPADRNAVTRKLGAFKTSMLQDAEAGRPIELDAMLTVVREIAATVGTPTPSLDALLGLTRLAARERGLYPTAS